jgi:hypothetical protein
MAAQFAASARRFRISAGVVRSAKRMMAPPEIVTLRAAE